MSTKIHNAFRLPELTLNELFYALASVRCDVEQAGRKIQDEWIAARATDFIDSATINPEGKNSETPFLDAMNELFAKQTEAKTTRHPNIDVAASVTILEDIGNLYCLIYAEHKQIRDLIVKGLKAEDFSFWDNSERPEEIGPDEWEERREVWFRILRYKTPASRGLTADFPAPAPTMSLKDAVNQQPPYETRLQASAMTLLYTQRVKEANLTGSAINNISEILQVFDECREAILAEDNDRTPAATGALEEARCLLKPRLSEEDFLGNR